jgi:hypothetical protein
VLSSHQPAALRQGRVLARAQIRALAPLPVALVIGVAFRPTPVQKRPRPLPILSPQAGLGAADRASTRSRATAAGSRLTPKNAGLGGKRPHPQVNLLMSRSGPLYNT